VNREQNCTNMDLSLAVSKNLWLLGNARRPHLNSSESLERHVKSCGVLIINADDWGRNAETTRRILDCVQLGTVSSASEMVFMEDSERAAALACEQKVDVGLHLNFTTRFSMRGCPDRLLGHQQQISRFLLRSRLAQLVYHPGLTRSFEYVVAAQIDEFRRLHGADPDRIDGHHHMHLCANVLLGELMPAQTIVRRNFSFAPKERSWINRHYRNWVDQRLKRRHQLVDLLFSLAPVNAVNRLRRVFLCAQNAVVEVETHPVNHDEFRFLTSRDIFDVIPNLNVAVGFASLIRNRAFKHTAGA
jgi:predicted glycoside hydrolase/deacetylase ChbG (UPF0249 family)